MNIEKCRDLLAVRRKSTDYNLAGMVDDGNRKLVETVAYVLAMERDFTDSWIEGLLEPDEEPTRPVGKCSGCGTPVYCAGGFCGVCEPHKA